MQKQKTDKNLFIELNLLWSIPVIVLCFTLIPIILTFRNSFHLAPFIKSFSIITSFTYISHCLNKKIENLAKKQRAKSLQL